MPANNHLHNENEMFGPTDSVASIHPRYDHYSFAPNMLDGLPKSVNDSGRNAERDFHFLLRNLLITDLLPTYKYLVIGEDRGNSIGWWER